jgi:hypothetical protein
MRYRIVAVLLAGSLPMGSVSSRASDDTTTRAEQRFIDLSTTRQGLMSTLLVPPELTQNQSANQQANQSGHSRRKRWIALVPVIAVVAILIWARASAPST